MGFRVLLAGGSGQVGSALLQALLACNACSEVVMVNRRAVELPADARLRQAVMDTAAESFSGEVDAVALRPCRYACEGRPPLFSCSPLPSPPHRGTQFFCAPGNSSPRMALS